MMTCIQKLCISLFLTISIARYNADASKVISSPQVVQTLTGGATTKSTTTKKEKRKLNSLDLALAGSIATMVGDASLHPVDCIKTLQQSTEGTGLTMIGAGRKIFKDFGIGGFYQGLGTYVISDGGAGAIKFATYEAIKQWINDKVPEEYMGAAVFGCAAIAFVASSVVLVPGELIKQRLQMGQYNTIGGAIQSIWQTEGPRGFFTGYSGVCLRDIPYTMLELGLYDNFKSIYLKIKNRNNTSGGEIKITQMDEIIAAAVTGGITGYLTNPLDMIKTKLMVDGPLYNGFFDCVRKTVEINGMTSLFQGGAARVAWLMPFTAIYLPLYDILKRKMEETPLKLKKVSSPLASVGGKGIAVKGGAQEKNDFFGSGFMKKNRLQMRMKRNYLKQHPLEGRVSFISF